MTNKTTSAIDLVERLRIIRGTQFTPIENALVTEAADTITRLQAALEPFAAYAGHFDKGAHGQSFKAPGANDFRKARDAYRSSVGGE